MPKRADDNGSSVVAAKLRPGIGDLARRASQPTPPKPAAEQTAAKSESGGGAEPRPAPQPVKQRPASDAAGRQFKKTVKFTLTDEDKAAMDELVRLIVSKVGGGRSSHVMRALWSVLQQAEDAIASMPPLPEKLNTPDNNDYPAIAVFEEELAHFLARAINRSNPS